MREERSSLSWSRRRSPKCPPGRSFGGTDFGGARYGAFHKVPGAQTELMALPHQSTSLAPLAGLSWRVRFFDGIDLLAKAHVGASASTTSVSNITRVAKLVHSDSRVSRPFASRSRSFNETGMREPCRAHLPENGLDPQEMVTNLILGWLGDTMLPRIGEFADGRSLSE